MTADESHSRIWREKLDDIANEELDGHSKLQMLIAALSASNLMALLALLSYFAGGITAESALMFGVSMATVFMGLHLLTSRSPVIARVLQQLDEWVMNNV